MFIGHFGAGFAGKQVSRKPSLGTMFMAAQFIDLLWPVFVLAGLEKVQIEPGNTAFTPLNFVYYPFTHSLAGVLLWSVGFGLVYYWLKKDRKSAALLGGLVLSHWVLDLLVHKPDLELLPGLSVTVGFGMWNSVPLTILIEGIIFGAGLYIYYKSSRAVNKTGMYSFWGFAVFLIVVYIMNILGDPPPSAEAIGYVGLSQWLLIVWGYWIDKNRQSV